MSTQNFYHITKFSSPHHTQQHTTPYTTRDDF